ncbi:MAG: 4-hydroxybutyrate CoA-transferase, partial [Oceanospirillaceae bacterium]|nr:4-hydroxybutyrate CoA-transferase [Oceanospirillaceae bacterium]
MQWRKEYDEKRLSPDAAVNLLKDSNNLILGMSVAMPPALLKALGHAFAKDQLPPLNVYYMHGTEALADSLLKNELEGKFTPRCLFLSSHDRKAIAGLQNPHWVEFVPCAFHQVGRLLTQQVEPDCFMVTVSPMDKHGYFSLGTNADYGASVIRKAKKVIVEVNPHMPRTFGECSVHISEVDALIEADNALSEVTEPAPSETDQLIARQVAEYIHDGDTLQMGVGGVPA